MADTWRTLAMLELILPATQSPGRDAIEQYLEHVRTLAAGVTEQLGNLTRNERTQPEPPALVAARLPLGSVTTDAALAWATATPILVRWDQTLLLGSPLLAQAGGMLLVEGLEMSTFEAMPPAAWDAVADTCQDGDKDRAAGLVQALITAIQ